MAFIIIEKPPVYHGENINKIYDIMGMLKAYLTSKSDTILTKTSFARPRIGPILAIVTVKKYLN